MVELKNVSFSYGELKVLEDFNLTVKDGESICLWGKSGCGKTTVLKLILGLEKANKGEISAPDKSRGAAAVFALVNPSEKSFTFKAKGADKSKNYVVYLDNGGESFTVTGKELCMNGVEVDISAALSSELILYKEI